LFKGSFSWFVCCFFSFDSFTCLGFLLHVYKLRPIRQLGELYGFFFFIKSNSSQGFWRCGKSIRQNFDTLISWLKWTASYGYIIYSLQIFWSFLALVLYNMQSLSYWLGNWETGRGRNRDFWGGRGTIRGIQLYISFALHLGT